MGGIRLGGVRTRIWKDGEGNTGKVCYRDPSSEEWEKFNADFAELLSARQAAEGAGGVAPSFGLSAAVLWARYGRDVVVSIEGFDVEGDEEPLVVLGRSAVGAQIFADIGREAFTNNSGIRLDLGKSGGSFDS